jgi:H+/gluconate symporter-like permease
VLVFVLFNIAKVHVLTALFCGAILSGIIFFRFYGSAKEIKPLLTKASIDAGSLTLIVCSLSAYGAVIAAMPSFPTITNAMFGLPGPAVIKAALAMMLVTGIAGSGPGGIGAGIPMFADTFKSMGVNMAALHRVAAFSGVSLDSLPQNAAVNVAAKLSGYSVGKTYLYSFFTTVLTTSLGTILVAIWLQVAPELA